MYKDAGKSAKNDKRPAYQEMMQDMRDGKINVIVAFKLDRLTRSVKDLIYLIEIFNKYDCTFNSQTEKIDTSNAVGRMFVKIIGIFAEFERELITARTKEGKEWAKAHNPNYREGMPRKYSQEQINFAWQLHVKNHMSYSDISKKIGISKATLYRRFREIRDNRK